MISPKKKRERETIITFNEIDPTANVYTCNLKLRRRLDKNVQLYPDKAKIVFEEKSPWGRKSTISKSYIIPKKWIGIKKLCDIPPREYRKRLLLANEMVRNNPKKSQNDLMSDKEIERKVKLRKKIYNERKDMK